jgi:uncharacterized protein (TIGR00288 family)
LTEQRLKFAVFIDFDNIEIGVRSTLSRRFDIDAVLEAIKERGEVVTKVAYGNWRRADEYSQAMTEHAVQMVQRNLTPRGDKNGADINLALDALEMAFTRDHINAFVIVGGDSDFIALVEKLKQYDKTVFIVGGRAFTSIILQKNCHEFIAYENLIGTAAPSKRTSGRPQTGSRATLEDALPLIRRALKILADREVSPQMGLLKSTLLQLDSTFSEKDYGTGSFREFMEKMAGAGYLNLRQVDRSVLVEIRDGQPQAHPAAPQPEPAAAEPAPGVPEPAPPARADTRDILNLFRNARVKARWPMYLRSMRQYLRAAEPGFDERALGFSTIHDLVRQGQREGILRVERNRHGILRIFPGDRFPSGEPHILPEELPEEEEVDAVPVEASVAPVEEIEVESGMAAEPLEAVVVEEVPVEEAAAAEPEPVPELLPLEERPKRKRRAAGSSPVRKSAASRRATPKKKTADA